MVLVHGWCAARENRGKGSRKGKIGARAGSSQFMDPVGIQSGSSRAPILHFFWHRFWPVGIQSGSSRDPVGHQFCSFWHLFWTCREAAKITQKHAKTLQKYCFLNKFGGFPTGARNCKIGARLVPDWIPTGSRLAKSGAKKMQGWCPNPSRLDRDWIPTGFPKKLSTPLFCKI